jgi:beta-phosphoglucomutase-like phosphatase (HAD superfamily)
VVIEDTAAGIAAGRAAGMPVLAVRGTYADDRLTEATAVIDSVGVLRCVIGDQELQLNW